MCALCLLIDSLFIHPAWREEQRDWFLVQAGHTFYRLLALGGTKNPAINRREIPSFLLSFHSTTER